MAETAGDRQEEELREDEDFKEEVELREEEEFKVGAVF